MMFGDELARERRRRAHEARSKRMIAAKAKGTHTKLEWEILHDLFGSCVACGVPYDVLHGGQATKDHIVPVIAGGCDCIGNIQPLCRNCNSSLVGGCCDYRNEAIPGWCKEFIEAVRRARRG